LTELAPIHDYLKLQHLKESDNVRFIEEGKLFVLDTDSSKQAEKIADWKNRIAIASRNNKRLPYDAWSVKEWYEIQEARTKAIESLPMSEEYIQIFGNEMTRGVNLKSEKAQREWLAEYDTTVSKLTSAVQANPSQAKIYYEELKEIWSKTTPNSPQRRKLLAAFPAGPKPSLPPRIKQPKVGTLKIIPAQPKSVAVPQQDEFGRFKEAQNRYLARRALLESDPTKRPSLDQARIKDRQIYSSSVQSKKWEEGIAKYDQLLVTESPAPVPTSMTASVSAPPISEADKNAFWDANRRYQARANQWRARINTAGQRPAEQRPLLIAFQDATQKYDRILTDVKRSGNWSSGATQMDQLLVLSSAPPTPTPSTPISEPSSASEIPEAPPAPEEPESLPPRPPVAQKARVVSKPAAIASATASTSAETKGNQALLESIQKGANLKKVQVKDLKKPTKSTGPPSIQEALQAKFAKQKQYQREEEEEEVKTEWTTGGDATFSSYNPPSSSSSRHHHRSSSHRHRHHRHHKSSSLHEKLDRHRHKTTYPKPTTSQDNSMSFSVSSTPSVDFEDAYRQAIRRGGGGSTTTSTSSHSTSAFSWYLLAPMSLLK
jgi:hypothetical protein